MLRLISIMVLALSLGSGPIALAQTLDSGTGLVASKAVNNPPRTKQARHAHPAATQQCSRSAGSGCPKPPH